MDKKEYINNLKGNNFSHPPITTDSEIILIEDNWDNPMTMSEILKESRFIDKTIKSKLWHEYCKITFSDVSK